MLQSLQAQNVALRIFVLGMLRTVANDRRQPIKEVLDFALEEVRAKQADSGSTAAGSGPLTPEAAYWEALEESLKELTGSLEVYSGDSPHG